MSGKSATMRGLFTYIVENNLSRKEPLQYRQPTHIGVDVTQWLYNLNLAGPNSNPWMMQVLGGAPAHLPHAIHQQLADFRAANLIPTFVFPGPMNPIRSSARETDLMQRSNAWDAYLESGTTLDFPRPLLTDLLPEIAAILAEEDADVIFAPSGVIPQLGYLVETHAVQTVWAAVDFLLCPVSQQPPFFLTKINFGMREQFSVEHQQFMRHLLAEYGIKNPMELIVAALFAGGNVCQTAPPFMDNYRIEDVFHAVRSHGDVNKHDPDQICLSVMSHSRFSVDRYLSEFVSGRIRLMHPLVMDRSGRVAPAYSDVLFRSNKDKHIVVGALGNHLPDQLYTLLFTGAARPELLAPLVFNRATLLAPRLSSVSYRTAVECAVSLRTLTLTSLTAGLHPDFRADDEPYYIKAATDSSARAIRLPRKAGLSRDEILRIATRNKPAAQAAGVWDLSMSAAMLADPVRPAPAENWVLLSALADALALHALGYCTTDLKPLPVLQLIAQSGYHAAPALLLVEMLRRGFTLDPVSIEPPLRTPRPAAPLAVDVISWLCCVNSLAPPAAGQWTGSLSPEVTAMGSAVALFRSELRLLFEAQVAALSLTSMPNQLSILSRISAKLPFRVDNGWWVAQVVRGILTNQGSYRYQSSGMLGAAKEWVLFACALIERLAVAEPQDSIIKLAKIVPEIRSTIDKLC
ncbi:Temperature dependent protein affecting M2 dsRNA replication [Carpediemonas membranifera]|uniref:Temperature dependent protein affecting M2 dsRNA replication n=1 Tax=Carpediemonas membranifera TaxID=201153 RepID=A0A8J6B2Y0_9EUKA|nr:Temperature dependent protein affecting M2 dsRNA replication [Carpediemonas membranifera]|eukprot:KAG9394578.1 Temperature dependent protein affecting M2 dsRNA replication [Carpediemonas membranifera]